MSVFYDFLRVCTLIMLLSHGNLSTNQVKLLMAGPASSRIKFRFPRPELQMRSNQHNDYQLTPLKVGCSRTTLFSVDGFRIKFKATSVDGRKIKCKALGEFTGADADAGVLASDTLKKTSSWPTKDIVYTLSLVLPLTTLGCVVAPRTILPHIAFVWKGTLVSFLLSFLLCFKTRLVGEAPPEKLVAMDRALTLGIYLLAILGFAELSNISLHYITTMFGIGGLIGTIAAKDILADVFHGMNMVLLKPFVVGDTVTVKKGGANITGKVVKMGVIFTVLRKGGSTITLHNSVFSEGAIFKKEAAEWRPRLTPITIASDELDLDKVDRISNEISTMLTKKDGIGSGKPPRCIVTSTKHSSVDFLIEFEAKVESHEELLALNQPLIKEYADIAKRHGAKLTGVEKIQSSEDSSMIETC